VIKDRWLTWRLKERGEGGDRNIEIEVEIKLVEGKQIIK